MSVSELLRSYWIQNFGSSDVFFQVNCDEEFSCTKLVGKESYGSNYLRNNLQLEQLMTRYGLARVKSWQLKPIIDSANEYKGIEVIITATR